MLASTCLARRKCSQTLYLLEVVTIISLIHPSEKPGAEPGKRDYSSKAEKTLVGDFAQGKRLGALCQSCWTGVPQRQDDLKLRSLDCSLRSNLVWVTAGGADLLHRRGRGELKAPGKSGSEEPGGIWNPAGAHEQCVCLFSLYSILPRGGVLIPFSSVLGMTSSVVTPSPSWGTRDQIKQAGVSVER